jgi:hypothetical protein
MPRHARPFSSRSSNSVWPDRSLHRAVSRSNHAAQSTSGKTAIRPLVGGHSISKELLISDAVSKSASPQKAITRACRRADESLPRPATDRSRPPDPVLRRTRGGRLARDPPTCRSRLSGSTRRRRPSCASTGRRGGPAGLRGRAFLGDTPIRRRSTSVVGKFAWTRDGFPRDESGRPPPKSAIVRGTRR